MTAIKTTGLLPIDDRALRWVDNTLGNLTIGQKIGQLMVFPHYGTFITPDVVSMIRDHHAGGLRIAQKFAPGAAEGRANGKGADGDPWRVPDADTFDRPEQLERISCTAAEFAATLNELRDMAMDRPGGVPLHMAFDQEGEGADFLFEQRLYPFPMGLAASGDPDLAYRVAHALARQTRALGANMIHSPVLDVNTHPDNPEIGPRAYGDDPGTVIRYALESLRGFHDGGIAATGKHFPGRGHSDSDAHFGLPEISLDRETLMRVHLAPYKALIEAGLPCVMAAFTSYPALGAAGVPGATSRAIVTDLLRGELGFDGVVTTDNVQMGGLLAKYGMGEAVVRCLLAGCDLVLCRAYSRQKHEVLGAVMQAVAEKRYSEADLDASVARVLRLRWKMGLVENGGKVDPAKAGAAFHQREITDLATEAAARSTVVLRDRAGLLPLPANRRIMLVEQIHHFHRFINNSYAHPGMLWREMRAHSPNVGVVAVNEKLTDADREAVLRRVGEADIIVATSYYNYRSHAIMVPLLEELRACGKPLVVLSNTPYRKFGVPDWVDTALVTFCASGRENLRVAAEILFGKRQATACLPVSKL
jgi:beta-N-acetylhexosaminidase